MDLKQLTLPGQIVKKSNELIRGKINIDSPVASRILASLLVQVHSDDKDFKGSYSVHAKDFLKNADGRSYKELKAVCKDLASATAFIDFSKRSDPEPDFEFLPFFSKLSYKKGTITATFNATMKPYLIYLKGKFTEYNIIDYIKLPSIYSQRMFEILKSWSGLPETTITMQELHFMLSTPDSFKNFAEFNRRVLDKAQKDINSNTELSFTYEPIKRGRAVHEIRFIFADKRQQALAVKQKKEPKNIAKQDKLIITARDCAKIKNGKCKQDNKKIICAICQDRRFLEAFAG